MNMKLVVFNGDYLAFKTFAGVSRYATEILAELDLLAIDMNIELVTPEYVEKLPKYKNIKVVKYGNQPLLKWKNTSLPRYIKDKNALLIDLTQALPLKIKGITCIYDCIPELFGTGYNGFFGKFIKKPIKLMQRKICIKNSIHILTDSYTAKNDIEKIYHIDSYKITVIGGAWQHIKRCEYDDSIIKKYNLENKKFCFSLGSRVEHKNLKWIIEAATQNENDIFVVSGENSYDTTFEKKEFPNNIIFTGYITDGQIRSLMAECKVFIFPSMYEGFGIPPMEAMAENAPIIISNTSCMPEIYRKSVHYIDPYNYENIDIDDILLEKIEKPEQVLESYSWKKSAKKLYILIKNIIK